ncbi:MAG: alpha/beta hydrolase [bacterium]
MKVEGPTHQFFKSSDGLELYFQSWIPEKKKGVLAVIHGLGDHSGRYRFLVDYFTKRGWALYLMDQRGHGKSPGPRLYAKNFQTLVDDLQAFLGEVRRREPHLPLFLVAHSFGAQISVNYLAGHAKDLHGAVLSSANLKLAMPVSGLKKLLGYGAGRLLPTFLIPNDIKPSWISHDPEVVKAYEQDPLVGHKISLRLGVEILNNLDKVMALAPKLKTPLYMLHGEGDQVTSLEGTREFFERLRVTDKTLKTYPGLLHECFNEIGKEKVFQDLEHWLNKRLEK